jgi:hypothetical protein
VGPFVKLKNREIETEKQGAVEHFALPHQLLLRSASHLKGIVEEPKQNTCVETHMPVVKYIPHGYRFSKETADKSKSSCRKSFISFGGLFCDVASTKIVCAASNYRMINE